MGTSSIHCFCLRSHHSIALLSGQNSSNIERFMPFIFFPFFQIRAELEKVVGGNRAEFNPGVNPWDSHGPGPVTSLGSLLEFLYLQSSVELFSSAGSILPLNTRKAFLTCSSFWQSLNSAQILLLLWNVALGKEDKNSRGADSSGKWSARKRGRAEHGSELCPEQTFPHC